MINQINSFLKEKIEQQIKELKTQNKTEQEIKEFILSFYKNFAVKDIQKILESLKPKEKRQPAIKKVNRIDPKDPRVENRNLGVYNSVDQDRAFFEGVNNKFFWQCAKCEYIWQNKSAAEYCFNIHSENRRLRTKKDKKIGDKLEVIIYNQIGRYNYKYTYEAEIIQEIENTEYSKIYEYRAVKRTA